VLRASDLKDRGAARLLLATCIAVVIIACLGGAVATGWLGHHTGPEQKAVTAATTPAARASASTTATSTGTTPTGTARPTATPHRVASKTPARASATTKPSVAPAPPAVGPTKSPMKNTPIGRDANGFALGGPPAPRGPANYEHPTHADCLRHLREVRAWSNYQNAHRPAGSTNYLPSSGDVQYLFVVCGLRY
jgi:hypothetical protein